MNDSNYVYFHIHPETNEIFYVGHGTLERAWVTRGNLNRVSGGLRSNEHAKFLQLLIDDGFLPNDWVHIVERNLSKSDACVLEQKLIREKSPQFNKPIGEKLLKLTKDQLDLAVEERAHGRFYKDIADQFGVSPMCMWRNINGRNKNVNV